MQDLDSFPDFECLSLIVGSFLNSFEGWSFEAKQKLDAVKNDLSFSHVGVGPKRLTFVIDRLRLAAVYAVNVPPELSKQVQWFSEA